MSNQGIKGLVFVFATIFQVYAHAKLTPAFENLALVVATQEMNLIGIGETHLEKNKKQLYLDLLLRLRKVFEKPFCLLIETPGGDYRRLTSKWPVREAFAMNIEVFGIDKPYSERRFHRIKSRIESLNERDIYMAKKIIALFKSKRCRAALLINGANHYRNFANSRTSLKSRLKENSILKPHFILRVDNEFLNPNGATAWEWLSGHYEDFDSVIVGRNLF
jgi:hypothetical protein